MEYFKVLFLKICNIIYQNLVHFNPIFKNKQPECTSKSNLFKYLKAPTVRYI